MRFCACLRVCVCVCVAVCLRVHVYVFCVVFVRVCERMQKAALDRAELAAERAAHPIATEHSLKPKFGATCVQFKRERAPHARGGRVTPPPR